MKGALVIPLCQRKGNIQASNNFSNGFSRRLFLPDRRKLSTLEPSRSCTPQRFRIVFLDVFCISHLFLCLFLSFSPLSPHSLLCSCHGHPREPISGFKIRCNVSQQICSVLKANVQRERNAVTVARSLGVWGPGSVGKKFILKLPSPFRVFIAYSPQSTTRTKLTGIKTSVVLK